MIKKAFSWVVAVLLIGGAAYGVAQAKTKAHPKSKAIHKLVLVRVCPITDQWVKGKGAGSEVVGKYKVLFCCKSCPPMFNKLSQKQKYQKIAMALKKQHMMMMKMKGMKGMKSMKGMKGMKGMKDMKNMSGMSKGSGAMCPMKS